MNLKETKEFQFGIYTEEEIEYLINNEKSLTYIYHKDKPLLLGSKVLLKVNTNIGVSDISDFHMEVNKLRQLSKLKYSPDTMMDHTYVPVKEPLWKIMLEEFDGPVGTLPHYSTFEEDKGIEINKFLETIEDMVLNGVAFMTLHPTATLSLLEIAKKTRKIPTTSRGGAIILKDALINKREKNIISDNFDHIMQLFKKHNVTLSIGTTFRPACLSEALDPIHIEEIREQKKYIDIAKKNGVNVMMEGIGHIVLNQIPTYCDLIRAYNTPLMPLGPMPTDASIGFDHITSAIGSTVAALNGNIGIINSVTREEHTGNVPTIESIIEGLKTSRVVAHSINISRFDSYRKIDDIIAEKRANNKSCVISGGLFMEQAIGDNEHGCSRCRYECPLTIFNKED